MTKRGVSRRRKYNPVPRRMLALLCSVMMIFSAIPGSMFASYADGTKSSGQLTLVPNAASAETGNEISVKVTAVAENDRKFTTFVLNTKSDGAGLSDDYDFDDENKTEINTLDNNKLTLHRETRTDGQYLYFFTLARGEKAAFSLVCMDSPDHSVKGTPLTEEEEKLYEAELSAERNTSDFAISINASSSDAEKTADTETASVSDAEKTAAATTSGSASTNKTVTETASQSNATVTGTTETTGDDGALPDGEVTNTSGTEAGKTAAETQETVNTLEFTFASGATIQQAEKEISTTLEKASGSNASKADSVRCSISWYEIISGSLKDFEDGLQATIYTDSSYTTESDDDAEITVSGRMPENAVIKAYPVDVTIDGAAVLASYDITIFDSAKENAHKFQPLSDYPVDVSISSAAIEASESVSVYHIADDDIGKEMSSDTAADTETKEKAPATVSKETAVATKVASFEPANEEVKFAAESFSIYAVTGNYSGASGYNYLVQGNNGAFTIYFTPTETEQVITLLHRPAQNDGDDSESDQWTTDKPGFVSFTGYEQEIIYDTDKNDGTQAVSLMKASITSPAGDNTTETVKIYYRSESITLTLIKLPALYIEDKISDTGIFAGCLRVDVTGKSGYSYTWQYSKTGKPNTWQDVQNNPGVIQMLQENSHTYTTVNAAIDSNAENVGLNDRLYYQLVAKKGSESETSNAYQVPYFTALQNTDFEKPASKHFYSNGDSALYWKSTGVGRGSSEGQDVELVNYAGESTESEFMADGVTYPGNTNSTNNNRFAEVNAEDAGSLYQDMITAPGATLTWSFYHRMRVRRGDNISKTATDTMYVVAISTQYAKEHCVSQSDIENLTINNSQITANDTECKGQTADGTTYSVWRIQDGRAWTSHTGKYIVPSGKDTNQYMTRIFLSSGQTAYDTRHPDSTYKHTIGNLVDNVAASSKLQYKIKYFVDGNEQTADEESDWGNPGSWVNAGKTSKYSGYALSSIVGGIQRTTGSGTSASTNISMFLTTSESTSPQEMDIYYVTKGITATKQIQYDSSLTDDELNAINLNMATKPYSIQYNLYSASDASMNTVLASAELSISSIDVTKGTGRGSGSGTAVFYTSDNIKFEPAVNTGYTIKELISTATGVPADYTLDEAKTGSTVKTIQTAVSTQTGQVTFINYYVKQPPKTITVTKTVADSNGVAADTTKNFKFTLKAKNPDNSAYTAAIKGLTKGKAEGTYTFTLKHGGSQAITLPYNSRYTIIETPDSQYTTTINGTATITGSTQDDAVLKDDVTVAYTNTVKTHTLTVKKSVTGAMSDTTKLFTFTLQLYDDEAHKTAHTGAITCPASPAIAHTESTETYTFNLDGGTNSSATFTIPDGVYYAVTEDKGGYTNTPPGNASGQLTADTTVVFTNNRDAAVPNGLNRDIVQYLIMLLAGLLATWVLVIHRRKREWQ